jgi:predicted metal-binding protein
MQSRMMLEDAGQPHILYICRTCPRYEKLPLTGEMTRGMNLVAAVRTLAAGWNGANMYKIMAAHCLNGCPAPCNVILAGPSKTRLRFHQLTAEDAALVLEAAQLYYGTADGEVAAERLPRALRSRLAASIPALDDCGRPLHRARLGPLP